MVDALSADGFALRLRDSEAVPSLWCATGSPDAPEHDRQTLRAARLP